MRYVVEFIGTDSVAYAKAFTGKDAAQAFAASLGNTLMEFYSEMIVEQTEDFIVYRRVETFAP